MAQHSPHFNTHTHQSTHITQAEQIAAALVEEAKPAVRTVASNAELEAEVRINKLRVCVFSAFLELLREVGRFTYVGVCVHVYEFPTTNHSKHTTSYNK